MLSDQDKTFKELEEDTEGKIWTIKSREFYYKSVEELYQAWEKWHKSDIFTEQVFWQGINNVISLVEKVEPYDLDKKEKLPKLYENGKKVLIEKVLQGLKNKGLENNSEYLERVKFELKVIAEKGYTDYFLIMEDIIGWTKNKFGSDSTGPGRGSASGSLVNYLLGITNVDPLKHDLLFERFLDLQRKDLPDIDCLHELTAVLLANGKIKQLKDIKIGDIILDHFNNPQKVINWTTRNAKEGYEKIIEIVVENNGEIGSFICPGHHRMIKSNNEECFIYDLNIGDEIKSFNREKAIVLQINEVNFNYNNIKLCDIQIENTQTFQIYPFKVDENLTAQNIIFYKNL